MKKALIVISLLIVFFLAGTIAIGMFLSSDEFEVTSGEKVGLVRVTGTILDSGDVVEELRKYAEDEDIKAVILRVESPGGVVAPSQEIFNEVVRTVQAKPVVASMGALAASGGYYVSAPASRIVANPGTLTGSIGVIMEIPNIKGLLDKAGIEAVVIKSGEHKDLASMFGDMRPEDRAILQGVLDDVHEQFIADVARARKMDVAELRKLADGRIYTGRQAFELGLVDELGGYEDSLRAAAHLAGIEGRPHVVEKKRKSAIVDFLTGEASIAGGVGRLFPQISLKYMLSM